LPPIVLILNSTGDFTMAFSAIPFDATELRDLHEALAVDPGRPVTAEMILTALGELARLKAAAAKTLSLSGTRRASKNPLLLDASRKAAAAAAAPKPKY
jgi:hypothetical protein